MVQTQTVQTQTRFIKTEASSTNGMVATKDRLATEAGLAMLGAGGNAMDAAVAACFAVGVVEPNSSGIGGGGYLTYQFGQRGGVVGFPMRGPLAAAPDMYKLTGDRAVGNFGWPGVVDNANLEGFQSIATPGAVAGLCEAHKLFGRLPLREVIAPAVQLAREGYAANWYRVYGIGQQIGKLLKYQELRHIFLPGDEMPSVDLINPAVIRNPELASVLEAIGREGASAFYEGDIAKAMVFDVQQNGGVLSEEDFRSYQPFVWESGLEIEYHGYTIRVPREACAGPTSAMTLKLLGGFDTASMGHNTVEMLHAYISSARLAYEDRFRYFADPNFVDVPFKGLLSDSYTERRRGLIGDNVIDFEPGDPWVDEGRTPRAVSVGSKPAWDNGTTHLCVIDKEGNAVSLTNTLMAGFGSGIVPKGTGVIMNNGMMWFDPVPGRVNSIAPGKFPVNNMTPALVLSKQGVELAVGASGGRRITNCVTQLIMKVLDYGMGPQEAIDSPRIDCSMPYTSVDPRIEEEVQAALQGRGHRLKPIAEVLLQEGFASFASPVAISRNKNGELRAGVDTFHTAYAEGLR